MSLSFNYNGVPSSLQQHQIQIITIRPAPRQLFTSDACQGARLQSLSRSQKTDDSNFLCVGFSLYWVTARAGEKSKSRGRKKSLVLSFSLAAHNREDVLLAAARCLVSVKGQKTPATSPASHMGCVIYMEPISSPSNLRSKN